MTRQQGLNFGGARPYAAKRSPARDRARCCVECDA